VPDRYNSDKDLGVCGLERGSKGLHDRERRVVQYINVSVMQAGLFRLSVHDLLGSEANSADGKETGGEATLVNE